MTDLKGFGATPPPSEGRGHRFDPRPTTSADRRTNEVSAPFGARAVGPSQSCWARQIIKGPIGALLTDPLKLIFSKGLSAIGIELRTVRSLNDSGRVRMCAFGRRRRKRVNWLTQSSAQVLTGEAFVDLLTEQGLFSP